MAGKQTEITVEWREEEFKRALGLSMLDRMELCCRHIERDIKVRLSGSPNTASSHKAEIGTRSGALRGSINSVWTGGPSSGTVDAKAKKQGATGLPNPGGTSLVVTGHVGTNLVHGAAHEFGATIRPKKAKWLTIPFPKEWGGGAVTANQVARGSAREFRDTFIVKSKKGNLIIFGKATAKSKKIVPLFILKKSVTIKARPFLRPAVTRNEAQVRRVFSEL